MSEETGLSAQHDIALVDLVDRLLAGGVVITGDITLSLASIDLVYLNLRLVLGSASTVLGERDASVDLPVTVDSHILENGKGDLRLPRLRASGCGTLTSPNRVGRDQASGA
jgi:hypothetical protein